MNALKIVRITAWAAIGIITVALLYVLLNPVDREQGTGVASIGGPFRLADHNGQMVTRPPCAGSLCLFFGFTHCPDVCPTSMLEITTISTRWAMPQRISGSIS